MSPQAFAICAISAGENGSTSLGSMLRGDLMPCAMFSADHLRSVQNPQKLPEQLQFLGSGDGLQGTSCPERVDFICRKFAD
jgi:hypothetical protein